MTARRFAFLTAIVVVGALALAPTASAWKWTFKTLDLGGGTAGSVTAKKCKGGKTGIYDYAGELSGPEITHTVRADMPAFAKFRDFENVQLTVSGPVVDQLNQVNPAIVTEIVNTFTAFYEETETKYKAKKGKLVFRYPSAVVLGSEVIPAGTSTETFKPKKGC